MERVRIQRQKGTARPLPDIDTRTPSGKPLPY